MNQERASEIIDKTNMISQVYQQYVSSLGAIGAEDLIRLYESIKENSKLVWKIQAAIIYEYFKRAEKVGDVVKDLMRDFNLKKTQLYSDRKVYETFFVDNEVDFQLDEKSWYVAALSADNPIEAMEWAEDQIMAGNHLSIRSFQSYIKQTKSDQDSRQATQRLLAAKKLDDDSVIDDANLKIFEPYGHQLVVVYADIEKEVPVYLYFKEFKEEERERGLK